LKGTQIEDKKDKKEEASYEQRLNSIKEEWLRFQEKMGISIKHQTLNWFLLKRERKIAKQILQPCQNNDFIGKTKIKRNR